MLYGVELPVMSGGCVENPECLMLGGSYNPVHLGHIALAEKGLQVAKSVVMVPAWRHAVKNSLAPFEERLELLYTIVEEQCSGCGGGIWVSDIEKRKKSRGKTLEVLDWLSGELGVHVGLLIGSDIDLSGWYKPNEIINHFGIWVVERSHHPRVSFWAIDQVHWITSEHLNGHSGGVKESARKGNWEALIGLMGIAAATLVRDNGWYGWPNGL